MNVIMIALTNDFPFFLVSIFSRLRRLGTRENECDVDVDVMDLRANNCCFPVAAIINLMLPLCFIPMPHSAFRVSPLNDV
ncbi:hypothetical protein Csa_012895 [Cucumis sativus]|uniref:Uncharacterized protein n=1 Tax=Cucumis sativus TaxID=3659 RepID=A0A0A0KZN4_CUCSA|nr:hypothetical protein Csa_012895 [Cucumis sativus]